MGYRSDVIFGVKKGMENNIKKVLMEYDLKFKTEVVNHRFKTVDSGEWLDDVWVIFSAEWLKWYEDYEDVQAITKIIEELSDENNSAFLVALGEQGETHSEIGDWWDFVSHISKIEIINP